MVDSKKDKRPKVSIFKVIKFGMKVTLDTVPILFIISNIVAIVHGVSWGFATFVTQQFYDSVSDILTKNGALSHAFLMIAALGLSFVAQHILNGVHNFIASVIFSEFDGEVLKIIHNKMARINPVVLEDTHFHDDMDKAVHGGKTAVITLHTGFTGLFFYVPYFTFMGFYLHNLKPQFAFAIALIFVPVALSQIIRTGIISKFEDSAAPVRREYDYYGKTITDREYFKETRMLGAYSFFLKRLIKSMKKLGAAEWAASKKTNLLEIGISIISALGYAGVLYMLVTALMSGEITVGAFAAVFGSIGFMFNLMQEMINMHIGRMASDMGKAHNFIRFMEMPERGGANAEPEFDKGIVAENISFTYPNSENKSVDGVSLEIKAGETVAIVGENGAGKTTLVRLLMGLYIPVEGKVILNGMDTSVVNNQSLFKGMSGVFQKFQRYQMTLKENVEISQSDNKTDINTAAEQAGVDINGSSFPDGSRTMLSREFEGVDLSGGEWQRVAIARGLYRTHNVVVLDEPTAAIDPLEESRIYHQFVEISKGKTAIIVTHRLGSAKIADRVVVMDKSKIVEIGSHDELLKSGGLYAEMYGAQAGWYEE